jgi:hypothetical protein
MTTRSRRETVHFKHAFLIKGIDRLLSPSDDEVIAVVPADFTRLSNES